MKQPKKFGLLVSFFATVASAAVVAPIVRQRQANWSISTQSKAISQLPITDYDRSDPANPQELAKRKVRNKKHDKSEWLISPADVADSTVRVDYLDPNLPALPVVQSDAVVTGEILDANAYLSDDKSGVYSEFTVRVEQIYKHDSIDMLARGCLIEIEREGGGVRFRSGKVHLYSIDKANIPRVGGVYILFLRRQDKDQAYQLLTAYEFSGGKVFPLDELPQFRAHEGSDMQTFQTELSAILAPAFNLKVEVRRNSPPLEQGLLTSFPYEA